jgi:DNA-binding response OmpR family regulator
LRALLRRSQAATSSILSFGPLELDTAQRLACIRGEGQIATPLELGPREWTVMEYLLLQAPKPANKDKLLQALTGWDKIVSAIRQWLRDNRSRRKTAGGMSRFLTGWLNRAADGSNGAKQTRESVEEIVRRASNAAR